MIRVQVSSHKKCVLKEDKNPKCERSDCDNLFEHIHSKSDIQTVYFLYHTAFSGETVILEQVFPDGLRNATSATGPSLAFPSFNEGG